MFSFLLNFSFTNKTQAIEIEEQKQLEPLMASSDFSQVQKASTRYNQIAALLEEKYARWEELAELE